MRTRVHFRRFVEDNQGHREDLRDEFRQKKAPRRRFKRVPGCRHSSRQLENTAGSGFISVGPASASHSPSERLLTEPVRASAVHFECKPTWPFFFHC